MFNVPLSVPEAMGLGVFRDDGDLRYCHAWACDTVDAEVDDGAERRRSMCLLKITAL